MFENSNERCKKCGHLMNRHDWDFIFDKHPSQTECKQVTCKDCPGNICNDS